MKPARDGSRLHLAEVAFIGGLIATCFLATPDSIAVASVEDGAWLELGPPLRSYHSFILDPVRDQVVIFGGSNPAGVASGDVWVRPLTDGGQWEVLEIPGAAPGPRMGQSAIYDPVGDQILVFGGRAGAGFDGPLQNDLWSLSFVGSPHWTQITLPGELPSSRENAHLGLDASRHRLYMMGDTEGDAWSVDLDAPPVWQRRLIRGWDPGSPTVYPRAQTPVPSGPWTYAAERNEILSPSRNNPQILWRAALGDTICWYLFEYYPGVIDEPFLWTGGAWPLVSADHGYARRWEQVDAGGRYFGPMHTLGVKYEIGNPPTSLQGDAAVWDPLRQRALVYGGALPYFWSVDPTLWALDLSPAATGWTRPFGQHGGPMVPDFMVPDVSHGRLITLGAGHIWGSAYSPEVWSLPLVPGGEWTQLADSAASYPWSVNFGSAFAVDPGANRLIAVMSFSDSAFVLELPLDGQSRWRNIPTPPPHPQPAMYVSASALDPARRTLFVVLGANQRQLWSFDLATPQWTHIASGDLPGVPSGTQDAGYGVVLAMDRTTDRLLQLASDSGSLQSGVVSLWEFSLATRDGWHLVRETPAGSYGPFTMAVDESRHRLLMSCRAGSTPLYWELSLDNPGVWRPLNPVHAAPGCDFLISFYDTARSQWVLGPSPHGQPQMFYAVQFEPLATPALVAIEDATVDESGAHVRWRVGSASTVYCIERDAGAGWQERATTSADGRGVVSIDDSDLAPASRVGYRLRWNPGEGDRYAGEVWLDVPVVSGIVPAIALRGPLANPARGAIELSYTLKPGRGAGTMQIVDLAGRVHWSARLDPGSGGPQSVQVAAAASWPAGIYFVRLSQGTEERRARFAHVR